MRYFILTITITLMIFSSNAQNTFQKVYGGTVIEVANSVKQTSDSGYIICGYSRSYGSGYADVYLIKTNVNGDTLWTKTYGNTGYQDGRSVQQTFDGGFIISGWEATTSSAYLIKTNTNGDTLWTRVIKDSLNQFVYGVFAESIEQTSDSGYIITGQASGHVYLLRLNSTGNIIWKKLFGGQSYMDAGSSVKETTDSGFIVAGSTKNFNSSGGTRRNIYLIKTNSVGDTIWTKTYDNNSNADSYCVQQTFDGGYILTGFTDVFPGKSFLLKTNSKGDTLWTKIFGSLAYLELYEVRQTSDSGYVIAGTIENTSANKPYALLIKTNNSGDTLWTKSFGLPHVSSSGEEAHSVQQTIDGGFIFAGVAVTLPGPNYRIYAVKTDASGNSLCNNYYLPITISSFNVQVGNPPTQVFSSFNVNPLFTTIVNNGCSITDVCSLTGLPEPELENTLSIFPNPFHSSASIHLNSSLSNSELKIYNTFGQQVRRQKIVSQTTTINRDGLSDGFYFFQVINSAGCLTSGMFVIE